MKVIAYEYFSWMLFQDGDTYYLSAMCGTVALYERVIQLTPAEIAEYKEAGEIFIKKLAGDITYYDCTGKYTNRSEDDFQEKAGFSAAIAEWKENRAANG